MTVATAMKTDISSTLDLEREGIEGGERWGESVPLPAPTTTSPPLKPSK